MAGPPGAPPPPSGPGTTIVVPGQGWVDVATRAITQVGFPVVIAGVLLWYLLGRFQTNIDLITQRMSDNTVVARQLVGSFSDELNELRVQTGEMRAQTAALKDLAQLLAKQDQYLQRQYYRPPPPQQEAPHP
jgi:hypothetical protein